jgi:hypothetical protein
MMHTEIRSGYYQKKMSILTRLLNVGEKLLSSLKDWESYNLHLAKKDALIEELKELEEGQESVNISRCTDAQRIEINRMIDLILALDKDIVKSIKKAQNQTLETIKTVTAKTRICEYGETAKCSGKLLDYRK